MAAVLAHQEREVPEARAQLEEALKQEARIPAIRADAAAGRLRAEQADARIRAIRTTLDAAQERSKDAEQLAAELRRRTTEAARAAVDAMLAGERGSVEEAARTLARAEELAELRRSEYELARARYRQVECEADAVLARYDPEHGRRLSEKARDKERKIQWALRQPRSVIVQLPVDWQQEAYDRYDRLQDDAAGYRKRLDERRVEALLNPRDAAGSEIRFDS